MKLRAGLLSAEAQRVQTIHLIKVNCIFFFKFKEGGGCVARIFDKLKQLRPGHRKYFFAVT